MTLSYAIALRNSQLDDITALIDAAVGAAHVKLYSGPRPADADQAATGTLLLDFVMSDPSFPGASAGTMLANAIASVAAAATGTVLWFRIEDGDANAIMDGDVTAVGLGGELEMDFLEVTIGQNAQVVSLTISLA